MFKLFLHVNNTVCLLCFPMTIPLIKLMPYLYLLADALPISPIPKVLARSLM